ncbi:MAG: RNA-binding domain-containing protein [archaeon]
MPYKESQTVELKKSLAHLDEALKSICAFLNHKGGAVYFGIDDKGKVIGLDVSDQTLRKISHQINTRIKPETAPEIKEIKEQGKSIILVKVPEGNNKPYFLNGIAYTRIGTEKRPIPPDELKRIIISQKKTTWDEEICEEATLNDIDEETMRFFLKEARIQRGLDIKEDVPIKEALMRLKLLKDSKPSNASILLFGKDPQNFFLQSEIKCIRFKGTNVTGPMIDFKVIKGNLINQLKKTEDFIFDHIPMAAWIEDMKLQRQEKWQYPPKALREAIANALAHRNYESASKVQVRIFDDRIEFWNPGNLPEGWSIETLKQKHDSVPTNPLVAKIFFFIKYIEEVGTGTNKIVEWCIKWGLPDPEFEYAGSSLVVTIRQTMKSAAIDVPDLNDRQKKAVDYLKEKGHINIKEYMELCSCSERTALRDIKDLTDKHVLARTGKGRATYYALKPQIPP